MKYIPNKCVFCDSDLKRNNIDNKKYICGLVILKIGEHYIACGKCKSLNNRRLLSKGDNNWISINNLERLNAEKESSEKNTTAS